MAKDAAYYYCKKTVEMEGIEPPTFRMRSGRSTTELHPRRLNCEQKMYHENVCMYKYVELSHILYRAL